MKTTLLYFSPTETTKKNLQSIAHGMEVEAEEIDITLPQNRKAVPAFGPEDFVIFGAPCYGGRSPLFIEEFFKQIKGDNTPCCVVSVYGNRAFDDQLVEMEDTFTANGFKVIAAAAMLGEHSKSAEVAANRPDETDAQLGEEFGEKLAKKLAENPEALSFGTIPGTRPYRERRPAAAVNPVPLTSESCIGCMLCAAKCPMGAISMNDVTEVDGSKCIGCNACVKACPVHAKAFENAAQVAAACMERFGKPDKMPEFFL